MIRSHKGTTRWEGGFNPTAHSHDYIGTKHILPALMREPNPAIRITLQHVNVSPEKVSARVEEILRARE